MKVLSDNLYVKLALAPKQTESGLFIPEQYQKQPNYGIVYKAGPKASRVEGDLVYFLMGAVTPMENGMGLVQERYCYRLYSGGEARLSHMDVQDGWVCVKIPYIIREEKIGSLYLAEAQDEDGKVLRACRHGIVVKVCKNAYNPLESIAASYINKDNKVELKIGDNVFYSHYVMNSIRTGNYLYDSYFTPDKGVTHYIIIPYKEVVCKIMDNKITPMSGYALASIKRKQKSLLYNMDGFRDSKFSIEYEAACDTRYMKTGDPIYFESSKKLPLLETELIKDLGKEYVYFRDTEPLLSYTGDYEKITVK